MSRNPAARILRRAARLLNAQAKALERLHSLNGVGHIWPGSQEPRKRRDEMRSLALQLNELSSALGRSVLMRGDRAELEVRP